MMMVIMLFEAFMRTRVFRSFSFWSFYVVQSFLVQLKTQGLAFRRTRVFGSSCFKTLRRTVVLRVFWCICSFWKSFLKTRVFTFFFFFSKLWQGPEFSEISGSFHVFLFYSLQGPEFLVCFFKSLMGFTVFRIFWCVCNFFLKILTRNRSSCKFLFKALTKTVGKHQIR